MVIDVPLDSIPVDLRVVSSAADRDGIREATVDAITPKWATVRFARLKQSPELCASPALTASQKRSERRFAFGPQVAGFGPALSVSGTWSWALFLGSRFMSW